MNGIASKHSEPSARVRLLMVLPTSAAGGHHAFYGLAVAAAAQARGWTIDLVTPKHELCHDAGIELAGAIQASGGNISPDSPTARVPS